MGHSGRAEFQRLSQLAQRHAIVKDTSAFVLISLIVQADLHYFLERRSDFSPLLTYPRLLDAQAYSNHQQVV